MSDTIGNIAGSTISGLFNWFGNKSANKTNEQIARDNMAMQKEFAQNSISWRAEDAKRAGLAPLAALGTQGSYYSPSAANAVNEFGGQGGIADSAGSVARELSTLGLAKAKAEVDSLDAQVEKTKVETELLEQEKGKQNLIGSMTAPNDFHGMGQSIPKDYIDIVSETAGGVFGIPSAWNAAKQQYTKNEQGRREQVELLKKQFNLPDLDDYMSSKLNRSVSTLGVPYIRFEPDWNKINKLPVAKQKRVLRMLEVVNHDYSLDKYEGSNWFKKGVNKLNRFWY